MVRQQRDPEPDRSYMNGLQQKLARQIDVAKTDLQGAERYLAEVMKKCSEHVLDPKVMGFAKCGVCGTGFGYRCDESPDGCCHYFSHDGLIQLVNGSTIPVPDDHDAEYETEDMCLFCQHPYERK